MLGDVGDAHLPQAGDDEGRRLAFVKRQARVGVQMAPPGCKGLCEIIVHDA